MDLGNVEQCHDDCKINIASVINVGESSTYMINFHCGQAGDQNSAAFWTLHYCQYCTFCSHHINHAHNRKKVAKKLWPFSPPPDRTKAQSYSSVQSSLQQHWPSLK
jgi:hypothetical protein